MTFEDDEYIDPSSMRMVRPMSMTDYYAFLGSTADEAEQRAFEHLSRKFEMSDFEVLSVSEPVGYGMTRLSPGSSKATLFFNLPDRLKRPGCEFNPEAVPVVVSKSGKVSVPLDDFLPLMAAKNVETGEMLWDQAINNMVTDLGTQVESQLRGCFGEHYYDREGTLFAFGGVVFNYVITLTHVHMQLTVTHGIQCPDRSKLGKKMLQMLSQAEAKRDGPQA